MESNNAQPTIIGSDDQTKTDQCAASASITAGVTTEPEIASTNQNKQKKRKHKSMAQKDKCSNASHETETLESDDQDVNKTIHSSALVYGLFTSYKELLL